MCAKEGAKQSGFRGAAGALIVAALCMPAVEAGPRYTDGAVSVGTLPDGVTSYIYGQLGAARNSSNTKEKISCTVTWTVLTPTIAVAQSTCTGTMGKSPYKTLTCTTTNKDFAKALRLMRSDSLVEMGINADGKCTGIEVDIASDFIRKN